MSENLFEEQSPLGAALEAFINEEITPNLTQWYKANVFPVSIVKRIGEKGWLGHFKEGDKWQESPMLESIVLYEKLSEISPGLAVGVLAHAQLGLLALSCFANDIQLKRYFQPAIEGQEFLAFANTEPTAGSDVANIKLQAKKINSGYLLNGTKMYITNGYTADTLIVSAVTNPKAERKHEGLSLFIVPAGSQGIERRKINKLVWHPSDLATIVFQDCFVPEENLLGRLDEGFKEIMTIFNSSRIAIAALTYGTALGAFKLALQRARRREAFGKKIIEHQAKAFQFSEMAAELEAAKLLVIKAAWLKDMGRDFVFNASAAKLIVGREARRITMWAAESFGASGIMEENPISRYPLDAWGSLLGEGTEDIQKHIIANQLSKKY